MEIIKLLFNSNTIPVYISFLTLVVILLTLYEMRQQRIFAYRPNIIINRKYIYIKNDNELRPIIWIDQENDEKEYSMFFYIKIKNIGFGSAHGLKVSWEINDERIIQMLNKYDSEKRLIIEEYEDKKYFKYMNYGFTADKENDEEISYIMQNEELEIKFPLILKNYLSFYPILKSRVVNTYHLSIKEILPMKLTIQYNDISNKIIIKEYEMLVDLIIENEKLDKPNQKVAIGILTAKEKNIKYISCKK